jgi:drug/metabolite transporter (DMT)-like permease
VFAAVIGMVVFGDRIAPVGLAGMAVVIVSGALAGWLAQQRPRTKAEPPPTSNPR